MTKPWLFDHRHEHGLRGWVARWWYARRVRRITAALATSKRHGSSDPRGAVAPLERVDGPSGSRRD